MNITATDLEPRNAWSDMHCQFVGITEFSQGQKVTVADFFKKDWNMSGTREICSKSMLKQQARMVWDEQQAALQQSVAKGELLKTEVNAKEARAKAMTARKPALSSMNTKLVVS